MNSCTLWRWWCLTSEQNEQLNVYEALRSCFAEGNKRNAGDDLAPLVLDYAGGDYLDLLQKVGRTMGEFLNRLKEADWKIESFSAPERYYFDCFKYNIKTLYFSLPSDGPKKEEIASRMEAVVNQLVGLKSVTLFKGTLAAIKDGETADQRTTAFYERCLKGKEQLKEVDLTRPPSLGIMNIIASKPTISRFEIDTRTFSPQNFRDLSANIDQIATSLSRLVQLKSLWLNQCGITATILARIAQSCRSLAILNLSDNQITNIDVFLPNLILVYLDNNPLENQDSLFMFTECHQLEILSLNHCFPDQVVSVVTIADALAHLEKLEILNLEGVHLTAEEIDQFSRFVHLKNLKIGGYRGSDELDGAVRSLQQQRLPFRIEFSSRPLVDPVFNIPPTTTYDRTDLGPRMNGFM
ncbi:MAG: hypothetical protein KGJ02_01155 [Verrucomicrobiota bacterium]|nr:hypothetical protein [Verrucomicrobiota bacterium]